MKIIRCTCSSMVYTVESGKIFNARTNKPHTCGEDIGIKENKVNNTIKVIPRPTARGISAYNLGIGEYARIVSHLGAQLNVGDIVLKTRFAVINISDPTITYDSEFSCPLVVKLDTGDKVEITVGLDADFETEIRRVGNSNKIEAIKRVREVTSWGLKESKEYVDKLLNPVTF